MRNNFKKSLSTLLVLIFFALRASANDYFVDASSGNDANTGASWSAAFRSISKALSVAQGPGMSTNIYVKQGTYVMPTTDYTFTNSSLKLQGGFASGSTGTDVSQYSAGNTTTMAFSSFAAGDKAIINIANSYNGPYNVTIKGFNETGLTQTANVSMSFFKATTATEKNTAFLVEDMNHFDNNVESLYDFQNLDASNSITFRNNIFKNNKGWDESLGSCISVNKSAVRLNLDKNVFDGNSNWGNGGGQSTETGVISLKNITANPVADIKTNNVFKNTLGTTFFTAANSGDFIVDGIVAPFEGASNSFKGSFLRAYSVLLETINTNTFTPAPNSGKTIVKNMTFQNNGSNPGNNQSIGGVIFIESKAGRGDVEISNNKFLNNIGGAHGQAIALFGTQNIVDPSLVPDVTLCNNLFEDNVSRNISTGQGGAVAFLGITDASGSKFGVINICNSTFNRNIAEIANYNGGATAALGGALAFNRIQATVTNITDTKFNDNYVVYGNGGAINFTFVNGPINLNNDSFCGNSAIGGHGGAYYVNTLSNTSVQSDVFTSNNCVYNHNGYSIATANPSTVFTSYGGAVSIGQVPVAHFKSNTFSENIATTSGAIQWASTKYDGNTIDRCVFVKNSAIANIGAINLSFTPTIDVTNSNFTANFARGNQAGAIVLSKGSNTTPSNLASISNCIFDANYYTTGGGAGAVYSGGEGKYIQISKCWFRKNYNSDLTTTTLNSDVYMFPAAGGSLQSQAKITNSKLQEALTTTNYIPMNITAASGNTATGNAAVFATTTPNGCAPSALILPNSSTTNPDINGGLVGLQIPGNVATNDLVEPGTTYGSPTAVAGNPSSSLPVVSPDGKYTFTTQVPGVYTFLVPVCPPNQTTGCPTETLTITVLDPVTPPYPPIANTDIVSTRIDTPVNIKVKSNDDAANPGGTLGLPSDITGAEPGSIVTVLSDGTIQYKPAPGFVGVDVFTYKVCETPSGLCTTATVEVTVEASNAPNSTTAADDFTTTSQGIPATGNVKTNDTDAQGDPQTVTAQGTSASPVVVPGVGSYYINSDGTYKFTPEPTFTGTFTTPYTTCDNVLAPNQKCASATLVVVVTPPPAVTNPDANAGMVKTPIPGNVSTNDDVPLGTTYGNPAVNPANPNSVLPVVNPDGTYTFTTPLPGIYTFQVPVCAPNKTTNCPTETLTITVKDPTKTNNPPVAMPDLASTPVGTLVNVPVKGNDAPNNPGGSLGMPTNVTGQETGSIVTVKADGTIDYTPAPGFVGTDEFTYQICETPSGLCATTTVTITVLEPGTPNTTVANDDYNTTSGNIPVGGNVKTNDKDPEGHTISVTPQTIDVADYKLVLNADGSYVFTPKNNYKGTVDVPYTITDNGSPVATDKATLHIVSKGLEPVTNPDVNEGLVKTTIPGNVNTNDIVPTGTTYGNPAVNPANPNSVLPTVNPDGTYTFVPTLPGIYTFLVPVCPPAQTTNCPTEKLTITVKDPASTTNPPVAIPDLATTPTNTLVNIPVKGNDAPNNPGGTLGLPTNLTGVDANAIVTVKPDGTIDYKPAPGFVGTDEFTYEICETPSGKCATTTVKVTVLDPATPNTTVANDDYATTTGNTPVSGNVKTNDKDPEGNTTVVTPQTIDNANYKLVLLADGSYTFTPKNGYKGTVDVPYTLTDNGSPIATAKATLHIVSNGFETKLNPDLAVGHTNESIPGDVSTNDQYTPTGTTYGTPVAVPGNPNTNVPTLTPDGKYTFTTPLPGLYTFKVPVCAPGVTVNCPLVLLTITVLEPCTSPNCVNPPVANTDQYGTLINTPITSELRDNDKVGHAGTLDNPTITTAPKHGTAVVNANGTVTYTPAAGFAGIDTLYYSVCESPIVVTKLCATSFVVYSITANIDQVSASDDYTTTSMNYPSTGNALKNDADILGHPITATPQTTTNSTGKLELSADGTYTYTPANGYVGQASFPYTVCDNIGNCTDATIHILVTLGPDLTPSQFVENANLAPGASTLVLVSIRNVGDGPTSAPYVFTISKFVSSTGLTAQIVNATSAVFQGTTYALNTNDYVINGTSPSRFTLTSISGKVLNPNSNDLVLVKVTRAVGSTTGAAVISANIAAGTGGGETPANNNIIGSTFTKL